MKLFRRASLRYSDSPVPVTPYQAAAQAWDERIGSSRVQARNWRLMAFGSLILAFVMAGALAWRSTRSIVTPYVVEVDSGGAIRAVGEAVTPYQPTDSQIGFHLTHFITDVRSLSNDPVIVRQDWLEAYGYTTDEAALTLNEYARTNDPFSRVGRFAVSVQVTSVVRASEHSFQVRWLERTYEHGALMTTEHWTAILTLILQPPRTEEQLRRNPLGIYVNGLSWARELTTDAGGKQS